MDSNIKRVFGNHNDLQLFIKYVKNKSDDSIPPFFPVLARSVNYSHSDHLMINAKYIHESLIKKLSMELKNKYIHFNTI